jgi:Cep192 domain 4
VNTISAAQTITLTNAGTVALSITRVTVSSQYAQTNTCGTSVAGGASCTISVTFKPTTTGTHSGKVTITDNATGSLKTVSLTGTGQ